MIVQSLVGFDDLRGLFHLTDSVVLLEEKRCLGRAGDASNRS